MVLGDAAGRDIAARLAEIVGADNLATGEHVSEDYAGDEALGTVRQKPRYVVKPACTKEVAALLRAATEAGVPVTARGSGSGLSAAARPKPGGMLVSFERMNAVLEVDTDNHVAVVQPGVTLSELDRVTSASGLSYTVYPGELSATVGGNIGTNAGGMRAVRYGVTRNNVLGLQAVLPTGEVIRSGGKVVKTSTGYDLTQLIIGSEGTLALATEVIVKLHPRLPATTTVLAPFTELNRVMAAVPPLIASGLAPHILEYIDAMTMAAITYSAELSLGIADDVRESAKAYLVVGLAHRDDQLLAADLETLGVLLDELGATDVYVLDGPPAHKLIEAREKAFWTAKAAGADDVIDVVVPRSAMPDFLAQATEAGEKLGAGVVGCGHAGDGNVHLAIFCPDPGQRRQVLHEIFSAGRELGGEISGEHGIGRAKKEHFLELEDPTKVELMRRIKQSFDPRGVLNPGVLFD